MSEADRNDQPPDDDSPNFIPPREASPRPGIETLQRLVDGRLISVSYRDDSGTLCSVVANTATLEGCVYAAEHAWLIRRRKIRGGPLMSPAEFSRVNEAYHAATHRSLRKPASVDALETAQAFGASQDVVATMAPPIDETLHFETLRSSNGSPISLIVDRITGNGCIIKDGESFVITKRAVAEPFAIDVETFEAVAAIYSRETRRTLAEPESVASSRAFATIMQRIDTMVSEAEAKVAKLRTKYFGEN